MKSLVSLLLLGAVLLAAPRTAAAFSQPTLDVTVGKSFAMDHEPSGGGLSAAIAPMWPFANHARFGVALFADDIGTDIDPLADDGSDLGMAASRHRWAWGGAWRGDADVMRGKRWVANVSGSMGWWRVEDDRSGRFLAAAGSVGIAAGLGIRRHMTPHHDAGLVVRWHELTSDRHSIFRRVDHYATASLEWRWLGTPRP